MDPSDCDAFVTCMNEEFEKVAAEYKTTDADLHWSCQESSNPPGEVLSESVQESLLLAIQACPMGIHRMSPDIPNLVQTSNNLARVHVCEGIISIQCLCRSSVNSEKDDHARSIASAFALAGLDTEYSGVYPGWTPNPSSDIVATMKALYEEKYGEEPRVIACHAGLECGILGTNYPEMDMVSFGPNIRGAHSPDECVQISSVQKFWDYLLDALQRIPVKQ
jgi:dipeptidase D